MAPIPGDTTPPPALLAIAAGWLNDQEAFDHEFAALRESLLGRDALIPDDWVEALAQDLDAALADRQLEWMRTLKEGRPPTEAVVEWEARDLDDRPQQAAEMRAEREETLCPLCGDVSSDGSVHLSCAHEEQARADLMPVDDAAEAAASQERWR